MAWFGDADEVNSATKGYPMSMIYRILAISDELAGQILADPERVHDLVYSFHKSPHTLSLEKSWHGLHFLIRLSVSDASLYQCASQLRA